MARKARSDSIKDEKARIERLQTKIVSPIKLVEEESDIFDGIIEGLPSETWNKMRIRLAASLAKMMFQLETLMVDVSMEGITIDNKRGTPVMNPKQNAVTTMANSIQSMTRTLGLSASQRGISETSTKAQKEAEVKTKEAIDKAAGSGGLLA